MANPTATNCIIDIAHISTNTTKTKMLKKYKSQKPKLPMKYPKEAQNKLNITPFNIMLVRKLRKRSFLYNDIFGGRIPNGKSELKSEVIMDAWAPTVLFNAG